jgi:hypothetical protein
MVSGNSSNTFTAWPKYAKLLDHDRQVAVLLIPDIAALAEIQHMCRMAIADCDHKDLLGSCMEITFTTKEEWIKTHG